MKNIILAVLLLAATTTFAQGEKKKTIEFTVAGKCDMCKTRIEKALYIKGVKFSEWNIETHKAKIIFDPRKTSEEKIHKAINEAGHDTEKSKTSDKNYKNLHGCCKYPRLELTENSDDKK